jgi:lysophospholipase L1-like esterase
MHFLSNTFLLTCLSLTYCKSFPLYLFLHQLAPLLVTSAAPSSPNPVPLRILPLGDSITYGYDSTDGNGYRQDLLNKLSSNPFFSPITYIGSQTNGNMANPNNEGHPGAIITEIVNFTTNHQALPARPNVVLLMAGTNDMIRNVDVATAPQRLGALIQ